MQDELQDPEGRVVQHLAVRRDRAEAVERLPAGADDELADPGPRRRAGRVLQREALVHVGVPVQDDVGSVVVEVLPERGHAAVRPDAAGRVERFVPVRELARAGMGGEIGAQPRLLRRPGPAAADLNAVRVQHVDVPAAEVVAVVALRGVAGERAEEAVVAGGVRRHVVVVPGRRLRGGLVDAPVRRVAVRVLVHGAALVRVVAERDDGGPGVLPEHLPRRLVRV